MSERRSGWGVPIAALGLVAAVWLSLHLSGSAPMNGAAGPSVEIPEPGDVPGFRSDAWFLPDEELLGFVQVPAGPFLMGSDPTADPLAFDIERWSATDPQGTVEVPAFYIARYEVTQAQFIAFARASGHRVADPLAVQGDPAHPVVGVSWTDAVAYTQWLDEKLRESSETPEPLARFLQAGGRVGLPTEAEWEKAARGDDGRLFPWGNEVRQDHANYRARATEPVGSFDCPECPYGLADMSGNVWELTRSPYQPYPYDGGDDRDDLETESLWVMRGGSFSDPEQNVRAAIRGGVDPGARRPDIGFRIVISRF